MRFDFRNSYGLHPIDEGLRPREVPGPFVIERNDKPGRALGVLLNERVVVGAGDKLASLKSEIEVVGSARRFKPFDVLI